MLLSTINDWLKRHVTLVSVALLAVGIFGAWLVGIFEGETNPTKEVTLLDLTLSFFGLVIFCAATVGVFLLFSWNRKPMTAAQGIAWEHVRATGKWSYVLNFTLRASAIIALAMLILVSIDRFTNLKIYAVVSAGIIGCIIYAGIRFWGYYEAEYHYLQSKLQHDNSLDVSGDRTSRN